MLFTAVLIICSLTARPSKFQDPEPGGHNHSERMSVSLALDDSPQRSEVPQRTPLLSPFSSQGSQRCAVEPQERIECGESGITAAECGDISCCYDANGCYYGKAVTLQCTRDGQFVLVVAREATMPHIRLDSIHMLENDQKGPCAPVISSASFSSYQFAVGSCGTMMKEESGLIIYENIMSSAYDVGAEAQGSLMRDRTYELKFQCRYSGPVVEALVLEVKTVPRLGSSLNAQIRLANGACYTDECTDEDVYSTYYSDYNYPVVKLLGEPLYVEVRLLDKIDVNSSLVLDQCWVTSTPEAECLGQRPLLRESCPYNDEHHLTSMVPDSRSELHFPSQHKRFIVKINTLLDGPPRMFIHCSTSVCQRSDKEPVCNGNSTKASTEKSNDCEKTIISSGEIVFVPTLPILDNLANEAGESSDDELWAAGALLAFAVCGLMFAVLIHQARTQPHPVPV